MVGIKNIVFDMGNVLLEWNVDKIIALFEQDEKRAATLKEVIFTSGIWEEQDRDALSPEQALDLVCTKMDRSYHEAVNKIFNKWYLHVDVYLELQTFAIQLSQKGYGIYVLSNTSNVYYAIEKAGLLPISKVLSGKILSFEEKCMKPDPAIFQILLERFQLDPSSCVFIDDVAANIQVAESLGIRGIRCISSQQVEQELTELLQLS